MGEVARGWRPRSPLARRAGTLAALLGVLLIGAQSGTALASSAGGFTPSTDDRYTLANGCWALQSQANDGYVTTSATGYAATAASPATAAPFRMQATDLGKYLFYDPNEDFLGIGLLPDLVESADAPSDNADWTVTKEGSDFRISNEVADRDLALGAADALVTVPAGTAGPAGLFDFATATGCPEYPEIEVNVDGPLPAGGSPSAPVSGLVETHMHQMAFEFLGGKAHCGQPWHRFGAPYALQDCPDHAQAGGCGAVLETALSGTTCHDAGGWPTFAGWPRHKQLTHEQSYYKWLERSWRGGLRVFVNLLVENRILCQIYPLTPPGHSCNEMDTVRLEAQRMRELERYIDAQNGGPGRGWYRIVESPAEARQAIADGKLAVVMGMEVSEPFDCILSGLTDTSQCSAEELDAGIDEVYDLGVRQLEFVNKFDNGLTGVAGDSGETGVITNGGNFLSTQKFWDYEHCDEPVNHDHSPTGLPDAPGHNDDELIANGLDLYSLVDVPNPLFYGPPPHCNKRGLSDLGERALRRVMDKRMLFDPDHMSVVARNKALDIVEDEDYPGVLTSHSWSTDNALPRIAEQDGLIGPAAKSPQGFVNEVNHIETDLGASFDGVGYGADMNGFASQGGPPAAPITYPFHPLVDPAVTVHEQRSGDFTFDYNTVGTAHYGLYPDWAEAVRSIDPDVGGKLANGAEEYLQMWERTVGTSGSGGPGPGGGQPSGPGPGAGSGSGKAGGGGGDGKKCDRLRAKLKKSKSKKAKRKLRNRIRKLDC